MNMLLPLNQLKINASSQHMICHQTIHKFSSELLNGIASAMHELSPLNCFGIYNKNSAECGVSPACPFFHKIEVNL